ncbi:hypothetical protein [Sandaracinus amylolyticus]|uniref:hypothetical protein n=1 Tax=Sandaracinus amylolyticus TaxID=927083 RepID=UPI001F2D588A|nr:hypothetical protein [Sandaracinus amylolyticus]UJR85942.1 Hypothetical protein I5071_80220 [Sandaracinus amylolyticus]
MIPARRVVDLRRMMLALTIGATAGVIVGALGGTIADGLVGRAAESATSASRLLAGIAAFAAGGAYLLGSTGHRRAAILLASGASVGIAAWLAVVAARAPGRAALALLESDRAGLEAVELEGRAWVAHRTLGFRLPQPSVALSPAEEIVRETSERAGPGWRDAHRLWAFESSDRAITVTLDLTRAEDASLEALDARARAAAGPLRAQGIEIEAQDARREGARCGSARFGAALAHGGRVEARVLAFEAPSSHRAFHLVVTIVGPEGADARAYLDEIVVPCDR